MIDMHVHFFPERLFHAIWSFFETESHGLWTIHRKVSGREIAAALAAEGVERFTTLVYAHKTGLAAYLNDFVEQTAAVYPAAIPFGTVFAGDGNCEAVARDLFERRRFAGIKLHPFVSGEALDDVRFFAVYEVMEALGRVLVCHQGSGPVYPEVDGACRLEAVLRQFPRLRVVVAHCGAFEYGDYERLAGAFEHVYFDTAMNCVHTAVFERNCPGPAFFARFGERVVFGSDFPNIPYEYSEQRASIERLGLEPELLDRILTRNATRLLECWLGGSTE